MKGSASGQRPGTRIEAKGWEMGKGFKARDMRNVSPGRELRPEEIAAAMDGVLRPHETESDRIEVLPPIALRAEPCCQSGLSG